MKTEAASERTPIVRIAVQGSCPVCAAVKHFQESLLTNLRTEKDARLCNVHAWTLAKSAPAEVAACVFLNALKFKERSAHFPPPCNGGESCQELYRKPSKRVLSAQLQNLKRSSKSSCNKQNVAIMPEGAYWDVPQSFSSLREGSWIRRSHAQGRAC